MGRVQDQVAVVTGAAHGLGRAIALRLAEEGARLALGDVDGPGLEKAVADIQTKGGTAFGLVGDVTDEGPAARLIAEAVARYGGRLDVLVNNVGGGARGKIWEMLVEDWVEEGLGVGYRALVIDRRIGLPTVRLEADFRAVSKMGDRVLLTLEVERLGGRSLTLALRCTGPGPEREPRMNMRQVLVTTWLDSHRAIDIPADLRAAIEGR